MVRVDPTHHATLASTRITNFLSSPLRPGLPIEQPPNGLDRACLQDEASLVDWVQGRVCINLTFRTAITLDVPLSQVSAKLNGHEVSFDAEKVTARDVSHEGAQTLVENIEARAFDASSLPRAANETLRVIERNAMVCGQRTRMTPETVRLELDVQDQTVASSWGEVFEWQIAER